MFDAIRDLLVGAKQTQARSELTLEKLAETNK